MRRIDSLVGVASADDELRVSPAPSPDDPSKSLLPNSSPGRSITDLWEANHDGEILSANYVVVRRDGDRLSPAFEDGKLTPRVKQRALASIRESGHDVVICAIDLDADLQDQNLDGFDVPQSKENKPTWSRELHDEFLRRLVKFDGLLAQHGIVGPTAWCHSLHGLRIRLVPDKPMTVEEFKTIRPLLAKFLSEAGVVPDDNATDWTRCFRAPRSQRPGGLRTDGFDLFSEEHDWSITFDVDIVAELAKQMLPQPIDRAPRSGGAEMPEHPPDANEALAVYDPAVHNTRSARPRRIALLAGEVEKNFVQAYAVVFDHETPPISDRNNTLFETVRDFVNAAFRINVKHGEGTVTPMHLFAVLRPVVQDLELEPGEMVDHWLETLWKMICTKWADRAEYARTAAREGADKQMRRVAGMREHAPFEPFLTGTDEECREALSQWYVIQVGDGGREFIVMQADGYYSRPVGKSQLVGTLQSAGIDEFVRLWKRPNTIGGEPSLRSVSEILAELRSPIVRSIEAHAGTTRTNLSQVTLGSDGELIGKVSVPAVGRRTDIKGEFSSDVQRWLWRLFGGRQKQAQFRRVLKWLGYALDVEAGPIAALAAHGKPGVGKNLLAQGLAEASTGFGSYATDRDLTSRFNAQLAKALVVLINEGTVKGPQKVRAFADAIRERVAGDSISIERKGLELSEVRIPHRVLLLANNPSILRELLGESQLTLDDTEALGDRILVVDLNPGVREWFQEKHAEARDVSGDPGRKWTDGWVQGVSGSPSNYTLAKHLLWLYENRRLFGEPEGRFLVEGNAHQIARESQADLALTELRILWNYLTSQNPTDTRPIVRVDDRKGAASEPELLVHTGALTVYSVSLSNRNSGGLVIPNDIRERDWRRLLLEGWGGRRTQTCLAGNARQRRVAIPWSRVEEMFAMTNVLKPVRNEEPTSCTVS